MTLCDVAWRGKAVGSCLAVICLVGGTVALVAIVTLGKNVEVCHRVWGGGWLCWMGRQERGAECSCFDAERAVEHRAWAGGGGWGGCLCMSGAGYVV